MPGLRFKKRAARRHTVDNLEQNVKDIEAAAVEQAQKKKEKEKFLELFKSKYPDHAKDVNLSIDDSRDSGINSGQLTNGNLSSGEEGDVIDGRSGRVLSPGAASIKRANSLSKKPNDHLFLRYHGEMKRKPMPKVLTMAGLKKLFVDGFHLDPVVASWPDNVLYTQDRHTDQWSELQEPSHAADTGILLLRDLNQTNLPLLQQPTHNSVDTDSTDASTTQSPITHRDKVGKTKKAHMYESIDDFRNSRARREGSSSCPSRDATPPISSLPRQPVISSSRVLHRRMSTSSIQAEQKINELQTHIVSGGKHLTHSMSSLASGGTPDHLVRSVKEVRRSVRQVRSEFQLLRSQHSRQLQTFEHFMKYSCGQIMSRVRSAVINTYHPGSSLRLQRMELEPEEEAYHVQSQETFNEFRLLEAAVDEIEVDVTQRQCRVQGVEIERLASAIASSARALIELQNRYLPLEDSIKIVMERELEVIVLEERMIKEEGQNLEEAIVKCKDMTETLLSMRKLISSQYNRSFSIPVICPAIEPDRQALLENIQAITPNHDARMNSLAIAEEAHRKKKELLFVDEVKVLARELRNGKLQLRTVIPIIELERRQQSLLKKLYLDEKSEKEQQQISDQELAQRALARRRELEQQREEEQKREDQRRAVEKKKLDNVKKLEEWRKEQQQQMAEEKQRRTNDSFASRTPLRSAAPGNRRSVALDGLPSSLTPQRVPMNQRYNSSGVPNRNSVHVPTNMPAEQQWKGGAQPRPKSMDMLNPTTPHHREGPVGGYPSPPSHQAPQIPHSSSRQHQTSQFTPRDNARKAHTMGYRASAVVHPTPPTQTHHNKLLDDPHHDQQQTPRSNKNTTTAVAMLNNYPSRPPPQRQQPYTTKYKATEHGHTLYSMV